MNYASTVEENMKKKKIQLNLFYIQCSLSSGVYVTVQ